VPSTALIPTSSYILIFKLFNIKESYNINCYFYIKYIVMFCRKVNFTKSVYILIFQVLTRYFNQIFFRFTLWI